MVWRSHHAFATKALHRASAEQFELPPRDRIIPEDQKPGQPAELSLEDAERLREKRARKAAQHDQDAARRPSPGKRPSSRTPSAGSNDADPWAKWRK